MTAARLRNAAVVALGLTALTFPLLAVRVNTIENTVEWRWWTLAGVGLGGFVLAYLWQVLLAYRDTSPGASGMRRFSLSGWLHRILNTPRVARPLAWACALAAIAFPWLPLASTYGINVATNALLYVMLGLGLNIVVGLAGLLHLGYVAFFAVGAYTYGLLSAYFGVGFWTALPLGGMAAMAFGILLGFPVLRLRGDYLAIVTLGFGEITRLILENWNDVTFGPTGIANIPRPGLFGLDLDFHASTVYVYYLMAALCVLTIFVVSRLQHSRIGRAWMALREDEIACEAMGVDRTMAKLSAFALGSLWAGLAGVVFAAKTTFINPASFTFMESAMILAIVVLGGMGSILGIVVAAFLIILLPEALRAFSDYRMILFGTLLVLMMIFRPQGLVSGIRKAYFFRKER